jgi:hypothetical protein
MRTYYEDIQQVCLGAFPHPRRSTPTRAEHHLSDVSLLPKIPTRAVKSVVVHGVCMALAEPVSGASRKEIDNMGLPALQRRLGPPLANRYQDKKT